jgi:hypothetical protein
MDMELISHFKGTASEKRVLRRMFGPKSEEVTQGWRKFIVKSFVISSLHQILYFIFFL